MALTQDKMPMMAAVIVGGALILLIVMKRGLAGISVSK
jgi:hypothetical protein